MSTREVDGSACHLSIPSAIPRMLVEAHATHGHWWVHMRLESTSRRGQDNSAVGQNGIFVCGGGGSRPLNSSR
jgi:hypothetical protein